MHGFSNNTCLKLLTHLWMAYGTINPDKLANNCIAMLMPWTLPMMIEVVFEQIDRCIRFAKASDDPISEPTAITNCLHVFKATGLFNLDIREWKARPSVSLLPSQSIFHTCQQNAFIGGPAECHDLIRQLHGKCRHCDQCDSPDDNKQPRCNSFTHEFGFENRPHAFTYTSSVHPVVPTD